MLQPVRSCPLQARPIFVPMATPNYSDCVISFRVTCWLFITLPLTCFLLSNFPFQLCVNWNHYLICNRAQFLYNFHYLMLLLLQMPCPLIGPFIFRVLVCHYQLLYPGLVLCVGLILPCRSFRQLPWCCVDWLATDLVRWLFCILITSLQKLTCVIKVVQYLLLFQAGLLDIESDWQAQYYSYSSIHSYPSQCGGWLSVTGSVAFGVASFSLCGPCGFSPLGFTRGGSSGISLYYSIPALLDLGNTKSSGGLGVEHLQPSLEVLGKLCVSSCCSSSSSSFQVSGGTCQRSNHTFDSDDTMLDGGSLASHSCQHVGRCSWAISHHKWSHHGCISRSCTQGSVISAINPWAAKRYVLHRQGFSSSVCQAVVGDNTEHLWQRSTSNAGRNGQVGVLERVCQTLPYLPQN